MNDRSHKQQIAKKTLSLYDSLTEKRKEINIESYSDTPFALYVCGITPYDYAHIGHARCYVTYDILVRLLRFSGAKITYVQNITDVNDKITAKAVSMHGSGNFYQEIVNYYFNDFASCCRALGCITPDDRPRVSQSIPDIIALIEKIFTAGYAYETSDGVYFAASKYDHYGDLSKRHNHEKDISRIDERSHQKLHSYDFALWKKQNTEPSWDSPWGQGVPGWHIECSAMIRKNFHRTIDLHGGGKDLLFPHHENEKAQSECCLPYPLAAHWMHVAFINFNNEKMSKSLGNSIYIKDLITKIDPMVFRYYLLLHQYQCPIEFSYDALMQARQAYTDIIGFFKNIPDQDDCTMRDMSFINNIIEKMEEVLTDNLNTAAFIGLFFKYQKNIKSSRLLFDKVRSYFVYVLGLSLVELAIGIDDSTVYDDNMQMHIDNLIALRKQARLEKNFVEADKIKAQLTALGVTVVDEKIR
jgi:cysteinyl-tRNA synthetase